MGVPMNVEPGLLNWLLCLCDKTLPTWLSRLAANWLRIRLGVSITTTWLSRFAANWLRLGLGLSITPTWLTRFPADWLRLGFRITPAWLSRFTTDWLWLWLWKRKRKSCRASVSVDGGTRYQKGHSREKITYHHDRMVVRAFHRLAQVPG